MGERNDNPVFEGAIELRDIKSHEGKVNMKVLYQRNENDVFPCTIFKETSREEAEITIMSGLMRGKQMTVKRADLKLPEIVADKHGEEFRVLVAHHSWDFICHKRLWLYGEDKPTPYKMTNGKGKSQFAVIVTMRDAQDANWALREIIKTGNAGKAAKWMEKNGWKLISTTKR